MLKWLQMKPENNTKDLKTYERGGTYGYS